MPTDLPVWFVQEFRDTVHILSQQKQAKLKGAVREETDIQGKYTHFDRIGSSSMQKRVSRNQDTPYHDESHSRRRCPLDDYDWAALIDNTDPTRMKISPQSPYVQAAVRAMNRQYDDVVIAAFNANAVAVDSDDSASNVALGSGQIIDSGGGSANFTLAKWKNAKRLLDDADVDEEDRYIALSPMAIRKLLDDVQVTSSDYAQVKALNDGMIRSFLGFTVIVTTRLPKTGNIRSAFAWQKDGMGIGLPIWQNLRIDELPGKNYATQVYANIVTGAVRVEEARVVQIDFDESL